jgi:hypothetical protein
MTDIEPAMRENNVSAAGSMTRAKRWRFTAITIALPLLLLLVIEAGLRIAGYGADYRLFVPVLDHPDYLVSNVEIGKRYFGSGPFAPTPQLDFFRARKELGTFRIVFQGESSALGFPYTHGAAPSRMLEQRLQASFPGKNIEVINTALTAVNSYTLLDEANEIIAQHPDAVMIYTGHNEYYGAFGSASSGRFGGGRLLVKSYLAIRRLRLGQLLSNAVARLMSPKQLATDDSAPRTVMQLMAGEQTVPFGSPQYRAGLEQFRANIRDLLSRYQSHGIPVFIGTVASNERDQAPFISGLSAGTDSLAWNALYRSAAAALSRGDSSGAQASLESAIAKDSTQAAAFYLLARIRDARGDFVRARVLYREAKDRDELRFRAPEAINDIIRSEARKAERTWSRPNRRSSAHRRRVSSGTA